MWEIHYLEILSLLAAEMTLFSSPSITLKYDNMMRAGKVIFHWR
jgi:ribosome-binding factor A